MKRHKLFCVNVVFCTLSEKDIDCDIILLQIYRYILHDNTRVMTRNKICFSGRYLRYNWHSFFLTVDILLSKTHVYYFRTSSFLFSHSVNLNINLGQCLCISVSFSTLLKVNESKKQAHKAVVTKSAHRDFPGYVECN